MPIPLSPGEPPPGEPAEELLAMVAHELRRPLTALLGALATVQQRGAALPAAQRRELLAIARRQGAQLQQLLDQLVAAQHHPEAAMSQWSLVDLAGLAQETGVAARLAHPDHQLTIEAAGPLLARVDPLAISRILGNLLDNAATHSPPGAPIRLTAGRNGPQAILAIHDQGPGIPPVERSRIFERYARLPQPNGPSGGGLGLGLYLARRLAHANRGEVQAIDPPDGCGACFELRLPLGR
jgi:signal transduction histidine kinase